MLLFSLTALGIFFTPGAKFLQQSEEKNNTKEPSPCVIELSLDFPYELEKRFDKMRSEDQDYAELIYDCQWPFEKPHFWSLKNQQFWP